VGDKNQVTQKVVLDPSKYIEGARKAAASARDSVAAINKELFHHKMSWQDTTNEVKKSATSMGRELAGLGKGFAKNLGKGALLGTATLGGAAIKASYSAGIASTIEFSKQMSQFSYKASLSVDKAEALRKKMLELGKTGVQLGTLPKAMSELYAYTKDSDKAAAVLDPIAQAAAVGNGDAGELAKFVAEQLSGQGKDINKGTTTELLNSVMQTLKGGNFNDVGEVMQAYSGVDQDKLRQSKLSSKEYGGLLAAGSLTGGSREQSSAAINALISGANTGFAGNAVLKGLLGTDLLKGGQVNTEGFKKASGRLSGMGLNDAQAKQLLQDSAGLSEQEATGLMAILRNVDKFTKGIEEQRRSTETVGKAYIATTDNVGMNLQRLQNMIEAGAMNLFHPLEKVFNELAKGNIGAAIKSAPAALSGAGKAVVENPGTVAAGLAATAAAGAIASKVGGMIFGKNATGSTGSLVKGLAMGSSLKAAGVTPVYVVNAAELAAANEGGPGVGLPKKLPGGAALATAGRFGMIGLAAGAGVATGMAINKGLEGTTVQKEFLDPFFDRLLDIFGTGPLAAKRMEVVIHSHDPAYSAKPKAGDNSRDPRGF
jgi:hypothetical protein